MNLQEEISKVAYELYQKSGKIGRDLENWLEAEKIVMAKYAKKEAAAAKQIEDVAGAAAQKVKKAVKETVAGIKTAAKKSLSKSK
ncbi:MAG: DUF2934 domain-containing protein [Deltaproteobacteria bacterium]|nr:DUF2934 domain-containing protein [Deltaproteobacteria bacterium]